MKRYCTTSRLIKNLSLSLASNSQSNIDIFSNQSHSQTLQRAPHNKLWPIDAQWSVFHTALVNSNLAAKLDYIRAYVHLTGHAL